MSTCRTVPTKEKCDSVFRQNQGCLEDREGKGEWVKDIHKSSTFPLYLFSNTGAMALSSECLTFKLENLVGLLIHLMSLTRSEA
jgi:hypothetical protein